jgi:hypothetical protein
MAPQGVKTAGARLEGRKALSIYEATRPLDVVRTDLRLDTTIVSPSGRGQAAAACC